MSTQKSNKISKIINNILEDSELDNLDILFDTLNRHFENKGRVFGWNGGVVMLTCINRFRN